MKFETITKSFSLKNLPESEVELSGEIPFETIAPYREAALTHIAEHMELPGFRPGKVPATMALQKVGEVGVLEEAVELFVKDFYPELVEAYKLEAVGRPEIRITKLAPDNPVGLTIRTSVYPEVKISDGWKKLHTEVAIEPALPATDEEIQKTLEELRQSRKKDDVVPELNDEFAKSVGAFTSLEHLKRADKKRHRRGEGAR